MNISRLQVAISMGQTGYVLRISQSWVVSEFSKSVFPVVFAIFWSTVDWNFCDDDSLCSFAWVQPTTVAMQQDQNLTFIARCKLMMIWSRCVNRFYVWHASESEIEAQRSRCQPNVLNTLIELPSCKCNLFQLLQLVKMCKGFHTDSILITWPKLVMLFLWIALTTKSLNLKG